MTKLVMHYYKNHMTYIELTPQTDFEGCDHQVPCCLPVMTLVNIVMCGRNMSSSNSSAVIYVLSVWIKPTFPLSNEWRQQLCRTNLLLIEPKIQIWAISAAPRVIASKSGHLSASPSSNILICLCLRPIVRFGIQLRLNFCHHLHFRINFHLCLHLCFHVRLYKN